mmetsp:Transcript_8673/g.18118  ORF Transcript_8673/g.18118 Transcript_8673/m.18118 type:complete len:202 (+) Transcript_8673:175-780(+)
MGKPTHRLPLEGSQPDSCSAFVGPVVAKRGRMRCDCRRNSKKSNDEAGLCATLRKGRRHGLPRIAIDVGIHVVVVVVFGVIYNSNNNNFGILVHTGLRGGGTGRSRRCPGRIHWGASEPRNRPGGRRKNFLSLRGLFRKGHHPVEGRLFRPGEESGCCRDLRCHLRPGVSGSHRAGPAEGVLQDPRRPAGGGREDTPGGPR